MSTEAPADLLTPDDVADVQRLQVFARHIVEGISIGRHASPQKGFSTDFKEHRGYVPGDQLRLLDWKLYAKTDRLYVRQFEEEINLRAMLVVDRSGSMNYAGQQSGGISKYHYACGLAAALTYLLLRQQDAVGLSVIDGGGDDHLPPRSRPNYLQEILRILVSRQPAADDRHDLHASLTAAATRIPARSLVFVLSDLLDDPARLVETFKLLRAARHDVVVFKVWHRDEAEFPFDRMVEFRDLEMSDRKRLLDCRNIAATYRKNVAAYARTLADGCRQHGVDLVDCTTDRRCGEPLRQLLAARGPRR